MKNTKNKSTRTRETQNKQKTHDIRLRNTQNNCPKMMKHRGVVYREKTANFKAKPLRVISIRVSEEDAEFLKSLPNASELIREAIDEERRKQRILESKGLPSEMVPEIAQAFINYIIEMFQEDRWDLQTYTEALSGPLFDIAELTLICPNPYYPEMRSLPSWNTLDNINEVLQSKEAKQFIMKIKAKVYYKGALEQYHINENVEPLDADELEIVRKIYDEAKTMLADAYRKTFHKLPPNDWHLTIIDGRPNHEHARLHYKLP
jgi:hypothetical protein